MTIKQRIGKLEQIDIDNAPVKPGVILFVNGQSTPEQKAQIDEAEANSQKVIIFTVVDASKQVLLRS